MIYSAANIFHWTSDIIHWTSDIIHWTSDIIPWMAENNHSTAGITQLTTDIIH